MNHRQRLALVIPGGAHTYSRGSDQFPSNAPDILVRGEGAWVWDANGRKYLDYGMSLRAVTLGYANPRVTEAACDAARQGNNLTRPSLLELEAAEMLVGMIDSADMVKFAKNGSNVTTAAVKVARSFTRRNLVCVPRQHPFFSFDDWFIGTTPMSRGIPREHDAHTRLFDYGRIETLEKIFSEHPGEVAAVMLEPATSHTWPCPPSCPSGISWENPCYLCPENGRNFLHSVQALCHRHGALLILDEMITGFRWHPGGAQRFFGLQPDLSTFGKAMANGFSVAALAGRREVMAVGAIEPEGGERTFLLSSTHGAEMCGLAAFLETARIYKEENVCRHLWKYGAQLREVLTEEAEKAGVKAYVRLVGPDIALALETLDSEGESSRGFLTLFAQEMVRHGVLMPWVAISTAHGEKELSLTRKAFRGALQTYQKALREGLCGLLEGPEIRPVFRAKN